MCGIIGTIGGQLNSDMIDSISHRGIAKYLYSTNIVDVAFWHLPINDGANGSQPFSYLDWKCIFNGEIYNAKELALRYGIQLETNCDTEIICKLVNKLGVVEAVKQFNGMFAIFLWNEVVPQFYLIRDRFGIKPLYYTWINGDIYFSSELKSFRHHPDFKPELNRTAVDEYLLYQNIVTYSTLYKNVFLLEEATIFETTTKKNIKYWEPNFQSEKMDFMEASEEVRRLMDKSIERQLTDNVKVGSFLSGGIDSNIIKSVAGDRIKSTFTASFDVGVNEVELAKINAAKNHNVCTFGSEAIKNNINHTIYHLEDLRVGACYSNNHLYSLASNNRCTVLIQGTGGDELFAGYKHRYDMKTDYRSVLNRNKYFSDNYIFWDDDSIEKRMAFDFKYFMQGVLMVGDKLSSSYTLEDRVPFLDNDLVDFALKIPFEMKRDKWILKHAYIDKLHPEILNAPKWGFTSPEHIWMEQNKEWLEQELLFIRDVIDVPSERNYALNWSLLSLEYWIKNYL